MAQHDYVIDNSTGANVRADINSALQAIVTNNSGSSAPSATFPFMLFADSSAGTMKIRNAADNAFIELFQLDGTFTLEDGSASTPGLAFRDDLNTGIFSGGADEFNIATGGNERFVITSSGAVGIGTASPATDIHTASSSDHVITHQSTSSGADIRMNFRDSGNTDRGGIHYLFNGNSLKFITSTSERMRIDSSGRFLLGSTSVTAVPIATTNRNPQAEIVGSLSGSNHHGSLSLRCTNDGAILYLGSSLSSGTRTTGSVVFLLNDGTDFHPGARIDCQNDDTTANNDTPGRLVFHTTADGGNNPTERMRIDSSGDMILGSDSSLGRLTVSKVQNNTSDGTFTNPHIRLNASNTTNNTGFTGIAYSVSTLTNYGWTAGALRVTNGTTGAFVFRSHVNSATGDERVRLSSSGYVHMGGQTINDPANNNSVGLSASGVIGFISVSRDSDIPLVVGITGSDTQLIRFMAQGSQEGNISVSGSTVSYNGGHLSRWSQIKGISTNDKSARPTIYQGTVMSNLDDLCVWSYPDQLYTEKDKEENQIPEGKDVGDVKKAAHTEENQQLNMTKVSDTEGDKDVAGVFWNWDDTNDDYYTNDFYIAMTGDMVIRVAASTTVARGDLMISAGDGTAKPQADDIIRSSTIAKIISTNATATYADGSKAYPCVLMAC